MNWSLDSDEHARAWFDMVKAHVDVPVHPSDIVFGKEYYVVNRDQHPQAGPVLVGVAVFEAANPDIHPMRYPWETNYLRVREWTRFHPDVQYEGTWWLHAGRTLIYEVPDTTPL